MLRVCVIYFGDNWYEYLPQCEFIYNNSYHSSIDMTPYEALYGRPAVISLVGAKLETSVIWDQTSSRRLLRRLRLSIGTWLLSRVAKRVTLVIVGDPWNSPLETKSSLRFFPIRKKCDLKKEKS